MHSKTVYQHLNVTEWTEQGRRTLFIFIGFLLLWWFWRHTLSPFSVKKYKKPPSQKETTPLTHTTNTSSHTKKDPNKEPPSQKETTPLTHTTNTSPRTKKDLTESNQEGDQQTKTTEKELPPPISEDNDTIMSTTNDKNQTKTTEKNYLHQ
jgi:hypothetical protein